MSYSCKLKFFIFTNNVFCYVKKIIVVFSLNILDNSKLIKKPCWVCLLDKTRFC